MMNTNYKIAVIFALFLAVPPILFAVDEEMPIQKVEENSLEQKVETPETEDLQPEVANIEIEPVPAVQEPAKLTPGNITMNFKGADIRTVLSYISEVAGVDIVAAPDVAGTIDLRLTDKPWKVVLDVIVRNYGFAYERDADIIRVVTLDKLKQEEVVTQAITLNYGKAKDVMASIKKIVSSRGKVKYDDRTNMLIVTDIPTNVYKVVQIIEKLDKETDQVLIEARILETVLGDDEKIGIDWNLKFEISGAKRPTTFPFDYFKSDSRLLEKYTPLVQTGVTTTLPTGGITDSITTATPAGYPASPQATNYSKGFPFVDYTQDLFKDTFSFGTLDFSQFSAVLEMVKSRAETSIISNPRIATLNNTEADILIGQTLNMPKYERNSSTGKIEITGYEAKDLGIKLKVMPHINEKDEIVVDLVPEISDLVRYDTIDATNGIVAPVFSSRQANTKVMIRDGDTIFIGGLIKEKVIDAKKKMPFLGDLLGDVPGVGLLFTKKEKTKQKTELIFFITVNIMKKGAQISSIPLVSKTYAPSYELSQEGWQKTIKKRTIK
ncbi:MAG: secretin N-terminal domain-containing protein [Candidatus Omnitrophota bacterium]|nr:secretin N-terminal domain-containing protein [Candidatus Omnitrophota bacterium]